MIGSEITSPAFISLFTAKRRAIQPPVIEAQRVPPSACNTSQSTVIWRSPNAGRSTQARRLRPIRRWISWVRPDCLPEDASRRMREPVERGSMPYSAVTQPLPPPRNHGGTRSSREAVHKTWVSPNLTRHDPSACFENPRSRVTARISSGLRLEGLIIAFRITFRALYLCAPLCSIGRLRSVC